MSLKAAITVLRPPDELRRLWQASSYRPEYVESAGAEVRFVEAPGDRGTEIHVTLDEGAPDGKLGHALEKLLGAAPLARVKDDLRRFKQHVETGVIARSDGSPEGERADRKMRQRPAQPLSESELQKVGV
jgi:uncharacterized membrane protein